MLREILLQETILFNNPQAESSRLEQDYSINKNESNNQQTIAVTVIEQRGNNPSAESSRIENENESNIQQTIVETVIEQRGKEIYKSCSICRKMLNRKSMNLHMRKIHNISVAVKRKVSNFID